MEEQKNKSDDKSPWALMYEEYKIVKKIGTGSYGKVYKAIRRKDEKACAIKV